MGNFNSNRLFRYSAAIDRLLSAARIRASLTGEIFSEFMVVEQVALRSVELAQASFYVEKAAIAAWLEDSPEIDEEVRARGLEFLSKGRKELNAWGRKRLSEIATSLAEEGDMRSPEEISFEVSGLSTSANRGKPKARNHKPISHHDIDRLTQELLDQDPLYNLLARLRKTKIANSQALSAVLLHSCWLTGMRPIEMFRCVLLIIKDDEAVMTPDDIDRVIPDITDRDNSGLQGLTAIGSAIQDLEKAAKGSVRLAIRNAKTRNANQETVQEYRILNLSGIDPYRLGVLWLTTQLRRLEVSAQEIGALRDLASRHARMAAKRIMPGRGNVTLYTMRHDFSDRAKLRFGKAEVAALMGHTSKNSGAHYGTKGLHRAKGGGPSIGKRNQMGWLPQPDEEQAKRLLAKWRPQFASGPEILMEIEDFEPAPIAASPTASPEPEIQHEPEAVAPESDGSSIPDPTPDF